MFNANTGNNDTFAHDRYFLANYRGFVKFVRLNVGQGMKQSLCNFYFGFFSLSTADWFVGMISFGTVNIRPGETEHRNVRGFL